MVRRPKDLTDEERNLCVQFILQSCSNGKPKRGRLVEAQVKFGISKSTVNRLWKAAKEQQAQGLAVHIVSKKMGRKRDHNLKPNYQALKELPVCERGCYRAMVKKMGVSRATLHRWGKAGLFKVFASYIKPSLTQDNKFLRVRFSLEALELDRVMNTLRYSSMHNIVHIDEKWFFITKGKNRYYLAPDEEDPYRACKSKRFIGKIMFMCTVSRPILRADGSVLFDGKIGCFSFTTQKKSLRNSKHGEKGTRYTIAMDSVTRDVMKSTILEKVIPAIKSKWPEQSSKNIFIEQDNAKPHVMDSDPEFREVATQDGFNIRLIQQPPNSPDTNINDLGFFNAIQSLQHRRVCKSVDALVKAVQDAFHDLPPMTLNKVFLTLQGCLTDIMKVQGHNKYKIPHMGKDRLIREGRLPVSLRIPMELARASIEYLVENGQIRGIEQLMARLGMQQLTGLEADFSRLGMQQIAGLESLMASISII